MPVVIEVKNLSKRYVISHCRQERYLALRDVIADKARSLTNKLLIRKGPGLPRSEDFWALKDVNIEVNQGERLGIIGPNGAGKTTLLKILSRITEPTKGRISIRGRLASLLEIGTGFHPELTGRENIYLNGAILGMNKSEIKRKFDEIVSFAGIERFLDTPVKRYSSGMYVRLAFAVAAHLNTDILLVDEVLAVGDLQFQQKCLGKMGEVARSGRTVLFVSHNMSAIRQFCSRCLLLDKGGIVIDSEVIPVTELYLAQVIGDTADKPEKSFAADPKKEFQLLKARLLNEANEVSRNFTCDEPVILELSFSVQRQVPGLYGYMMISKNDGTCVLEADSYDGGENSLDNLSPGAHTATIAIPARTLGCGDYSIYLNFTSSMSSGNFDVDSPGVVASFHLDDLTSRRGNKRRGYFSLLLPWRMR